MSKPIRVSYSKARLSIRDGDLLLFRPRGFIWRLIAVAGRSKYTHAAMAARWHGRIHCLQQTSDEDHKPLLSELVKRWPGVIDVYSVVKTPYNRTAAVKAMIAIAGKHYGWWNLFRASFCHLPVVRLFVKPDLDDKSTTVESPFCSQAVSDVMRIGGVDPVPNLSDRLTEPGDLARSSAFKYRFTLVS